MVSNLYHNDCQPHSSCRSSNQSSALSSFSIAQAAAWLQEFQRKCIHSVTFHVNMDASSEMLQMKKRNQVVALDSSLLVPSSCNAGTSPWIYSLEVKFHLKVWQITSQGEAWTSPIPQYLRLNRVEAVCCTVSLALLAMPQGWMAKIQETWIQQTTHSSINSNQHLEVSKKWEYPQFSSIFFVLPYKPSSY
jgi:hypothetical protein